jgi:hypothetical protein
VAISRHYLYSEFPPKLTFENKIVIFADRVRGWQLYPAEEVIEINPHAGFIVLFSLMHYFEMIGKYIGGFIDERKSGIFFNIGFKDVSSYLGPGISELPDSDINNIYEKVRNALYHTGLTGHGVVLTGDADYAIQVKDTTIVINPHELVISLHKHFDAYLVKLNDPNEKILRQNFEKRFDYLHG